MLDLRYQVLVDPTGALHAFRLNAEIFLFWSWFSALYCAGAVELEILVCLVDAPVYDERFPLKQVLPSRRRRCSTPDLTQGGDIYSRRPSFFLLFLCVATQLRVLSVVAGGSRPASSSR